MYAPLFQSLGLSPNEAQIYEALITYGRNGVSTLSLRAKVHRRNVYDIVQRLQEKGLVNKVFEEGETIYEAVNPRKLMESIEEKERMLEAALPNLLSIYRDQRAPQRAYIYKGVEGVKNYLRAILRVGKDIHSFAGKGVWFDPRLKGFTEWFESERRKKNVKHFHIWDAELQKDPPGPLGSKGHYKFLPKQYSTTSTLDIFGDYIVTFTGVGKGQIQDDMTIFVIVSPQLAEGYRTWWKFMWDSLPIPTSSTPKRKQKRL